MTCAPPATTPACRFYGRSHVVLKAAGILFDQHGNECAAIWDSYSPCRMRTLLRRDPDENVCPIARGFLRRIGCERKP